MSKARGERPPTCAHCGAVQPKGAKRCSACGTLASFGTTTTPVPLAPVPGTVAGSATATPAPAAPSASRPGPSIGPAGYPSRSTAPTVTIVKRRSLLGSLLSALLTFVLTIFTAMAMLVVIAFGAAFVINRTAKEGPKTVIGEPVIPIPSWAKSPFGKTDDGRAIPSLSAVAYVCGGKPFPEGLLKDSTTPATGIAYLWHNSANRPATDFVRGQGSIPGPVIDPLSASTITHDVNIAANVAPLGYVACITLVDRGPGEDVKYTTPAEQRDTVPGGNPNGPIHVVTWHAHTVWKVELFGTDSGKVIGRGLLVASEEKPSQIVDDGTGENSDDRGAELTTEQINTLVANLTR